MTNKPMLSVERELLERAASAIEKHYGSLQWVIASELRALLDKEVDFLTPDCPDCACVQDGHCLCIPSKPAAQQQGGPVAICRLWNEGGSGERTSVEFVGEPCADGALLYAEQPAPVADHTQCEECKGWGYHENHYEGGGTECGECGGSGNATVDVVIPERMYSDSLPSWAEEQRLVRGWNACIEEVARLNGLKT